MVHINRFESNGYTFQIFHCDDKTDLDKIDNLNQSYLMSARYFPVNNENEKECWEIFEMCTSDILAKLADLRKENKSFYDNFDCTDNFSHSSISAYRESGRQKINFMEVFYDTKLKNINEK